MGGGEYNVNVPHAAELYALTWFKSRFRLSIFYDNKNQAQKVSRK